MLNEQQILDKLRGVIDPELNLNIVDLGLVYEVLISGESVKIVMTLTAPGCPLAPMIEGQVKDMVSQFKEVKDVDVEITFEPPWNPSMMSEEAKLELGFNI